MKPIKPGSVLAALLLACAALAQNSNPPAGSGQQPVSYASASEVNTLLAQLESTAQSATAALARMRINKWKTDSSTKQQEQANAESIQRNLQSALPGLISAVRANPDDVAASFKLFRNLDALYDVMSNVAESAGAFGPRDDYQALESSFNNLDRVRRSFADRVESLAVSHQSELARLRNQVRAAQAAAPPPPPKKVIVDDNEPAKKASHKRKPPSKPKAAPPAAGTNAGSSPPQ
jgi:hypothetical protein